MEESVFSIDEDNLSRILIQRDFTEEELEFLVYKRDLKGVDLFYIAKFQPLSENIIRILREKLCELSVCSGFGRTDIISSFDNIISNNPRAHNSDALSKISSINNCPGKDYFRIWRANDLELDTDGNRVWIRELCSIDVARDIYKRVIDYVLCYRVMKSSIIYVYGDPMSSFIIDKDGLILESHNSFLWRGGGEVVL